MILSAAFIVFAGVAAVISASPSVSRRDEPNNISSPNLGYNELYRLQNQFYERFKYPNNVVEAHSINSSVFAENVQGRVSDTRNFQGRELNTEYIFGLFIPSDSVSIIGRPGDFEILQFAANQNIASASTRVNFTFPSFGGIHMPIVIDTWFTYNDKKEISQYDVVFRWFGYLLQNLLTSLDPDPVVGIKKATMALATSICTSEQTYCNGTNSQFGSQNECMTFLTQDIRLGQSFELGMNTLLCRSVHEVMIKYRPDVHCSHVGRDGGGMCDDSISYLEKANEAYYENSPWIPTVS
ncbi:hypothetical protein P154DRAFT_574423 [Amniculicola lignicola CBS 123094]|uniref:Uncharacterized protein n=1 Tax=Amniculicola lignicola CBS 123094 TaxID=1392246 RepID=A0A6A5WMX6_9PLEO|nr:hypothetical protein P154DRAFT_574423 [Amniculicola lignicola CBS 123094]